MSEYVNYLNNLTNSINFYYSAVFVSLGYCFNALTIIIFARKNLRSSANMSLFYITLAVADSFALMNSTLVNQLLPNVGINLNSYSDSMCRFISLFTRVVIQYPSWVQVVLTFDRYRMVCHPARLLFMKSKYYVSGILFLTLVCIVIVNSEMLWYFGLTITSKSFVNVTTSSGNWSIQEIVSTRIQCSSPGVLSNVTKLINVFMRAYIPLAIMLVMNILLLKTYIRNKQRLGLNNGGARERNFTNTVLATNILFFTMYTPWSVYFIVNTFYTNQPPLAGAILNMFQYVALSLAYMQVYLIFFLNFAFNTLFRNEVYKMLNLERNIVSMKTSVLTAGGGNNNSVLANNKQTGNENENAI